MTKLTFWLRIVALIFAWGGMLIFVWAPEPSWRLFASSAFVIVLIALDDIEAQIKRLLED